MPDTPSRLFCCAVLVAALAGSLSGCDIVQQQLGIEDQNLKAARNDADGKAVGGACRQSGRAIEDCYAIYSWLPKSSIYEGWRDMDAYMRENKLEGTPSVLGKAEPKAEPRRSRASNADDDNS